MLNSTLIGLFATGVWIDLGQPTNTSPSTISGYAIQPSTLGRLNNLVGGCFSGSGFTGNGSVNYQIGPFVTEAELGIIGAMYLVSYYNNLAQANMGIGGTAIPWTSLAEGDSRIARSNASNLGSEYREMSKEASVQLNYLVNAYRGSEGANLARSVDYLNPYWADSTIWPT